MSIWSKFFGNNERQRKANNTQPKNASEDQTLEVGLRALRKSVVQAEVWSDDKAALENLAANKESLFSQLTMSNRTGRLTDANLRGAMAAYARGDYKIEERDGKFGLIFYGMPSGAELQKSVSTDNRRMKIIKEGDAPTCEICGQPAKAHTGISRKYFRLNNGKPAIMHAGWCMQCLFTRQNEHQNPTEEEIIALASRETENG